MSNLKKIFLGLVVCLTTALPFGLTASESVQVKNAVIQENSTQDVSNVYWRGGWGRGYGWGGGYGRGYWGGGYGYRGYSGYPYSYGYGYGYPYNYGYGYGYGGCSSCNNNWWGW